MKYENKDWGRGSRGLNREGRLNRGFTVLPNSYISCICFIFSHLAMDLFIGLFCLFIFVSVLAILFLLRRVSVLQWQLEATSGARDHALRGWQRAAEELGATSGARDRALRGWKRAVEELNLVEWLLQPFLERFQ